MHLLQIAKKLANDAGQLAVEYQKKGVKVHSKGEHNNKVTDADKAVEAFIVKTIRDNFPDHGIISEESEVIHGNSEYKWIIDPIDGTSNFIHGLPMFCISIAVIKNGKPIIGVIEIPRTKETFWAKHGHGAHLNNKKIYVSKVHKIEEGLFATGFPYERGKRFEKTVELFEAFYKDTLGVRRMGSAAIDLAYLAAGRFDGFFEYGLEAWDIAAGKIIVEEAGGVVTNMDGSTLNPKLKNILASNGSMHQGMMDRIKANGGLDL